MKQITIQSPFVLGDVVYLKVDDNERRPGMVTRLNLAPNGVSYEVTWCQGCPASWHYAIELSSTYVPDFVGDRGSDPTDAA